MTNYQIIAKKFRPQTFSSVCGQTSIVRALKNAIHLNRLANAYLFCGSRGTGKTTLARILAKAINCQNPTADCEPCNLCSSCREITAGRSLDVIEIDGASNRGIDDIRQLSDTAGYAPAHGKYKLYIIDEVHMLTKEAFNALLKTLEEPPSHVKFFFATTEGHKVLPTIVSRCQRYDLNRISSNEVIGKLKIIGKQLGVVIEDEALNAVADLSEGSLRDAESMLDQLICLSDKKITQKIVNDAFGLPSKKMFFRLDEAIYNKNLSFAFELSQELFSSGTHLVHFVENLARHYRNILMFKLQIPIDPLSKDEKYTNSAELYTESHCLYILEYLTKWIQEIHLSSFKRINIEMILLHLLQSKDRISIDVLVKRLAALETTDAPVELPKVEIAKIPLPQSDEPKINPPILEKEPEQIKKPVEIAPIAPQSNEPKISPPVLEKEPEQIKKNVDKPSFFEKQHRYDTILQFASIELNGSIKK
ncbi:MAG: DNA polymerase III subunit gamma/tau [Simkaniaceae bacterium]|nr:DNA polymerase III subunit gamma/tau [Simkaniaceae bacterium]